jgi:hypothetical protein
MRQWRTTLLPTTTHLKEVVKFAAIIVAILPLLGVAKAEEMFSPTTAITLPNGAKITSFDISFVDPVLQLYLLADRTNKVVHAIDVSSNTIVAEFSSNFAGATPSNDDAGPDGVITVNHQEVWAGDGPSEVKVIDLTSQVTTHVINTGGMHRADELCVDPRDHVVMVANDAESPFPFVTFISTQTYGILGKMTMDGTVANGGTIASPKATNGIEQCQWDQRTGEFYVNIPEVNGPGNDTMPGAVVVINPKKLRIDAVFNIPLSSCAGPQGMAIGHSHQILLGCNDPNKTVPSTVIIDDRNGNVLNVIPGEDGSDEVWFNDSDQSYFLARSGGAHPQQLGIVDANGSHAGTVDQDITVGLPNNPPSSPHGTAHSVAVDPVFMQVYMPIPSTSGGTICSSAGGTDSQGCIAVFTTPNNGQDGEGGDGGHGHGGQGGNGQGGNGQGGQGNGKGGGHGD